MDDRKRVAGIIRDHIARERMSREQFAFRTKLGKSTVDKLLVGLFSDKTLAIVEGQTGLALRPSHASKGRSAPLSDAASETAPGPAPGLPDGPSIAVLPFTNMSGDSAQDYFAAASPRTSPPTSRACAGCS
jgi:adenylate cyclase